MDKELYLLDTINTMIDSCEPIYIKDFNKKYKQIDNKLIVAEKENDKIGIGYNDGAYTISTLSIIATITDCLVDKRLAFCIETEGEDKGRILGVQWFNYDTVIEDK